jgi:hypothetical protein
MTTTIDPTVPANDESERTHLEALTVEQLTRICEHNAIDLPDGRATVKKLVGVIMACEFLPEYPADVPAYDPDTEPSNDATTGETVDPDDLPELAADNAQHDASMGGGKGNPEKIEDSWDKAEPHDQLTLVPGGEKPTKSLVAIGAVSQELSNLQFEDEDEVLVTFRAKVDIIAFPKERKGGKVLRRVRRHSLKIIPGTFGIELAE